MRRRRSASVLSRKLVAALRGAGIELAGDADDYCISRTRAGSNQRSHGAWSWALDYVATGLSAGIGSQWSAREIVAAGALDIHEYRWGDIDVAPRQAAGDRS